MTWVRHADDWPDPVTGRAEQAYDATLRPTDRTAAWRPAGPRPVRRIEEPSIPVPEGVAVTNDADWRVHFARLHALPLGSSNAEKQQRGADFEVALRGMFQAAGMDPRSRYRPSAEEIDGSFLYRGRVMLFEAKWTRDPVPASALYQFRGKLDGKLAGTLGAFLSMAGYSKDAVDALVAGKSLNLILFDGEDMRKLSEPGCIGIKTALDLKLRGAAERR